MKINQEEEDEVVVDLEEEEEEEVEVDKALTSLPLSAIIAISSDIFNMNVQTRKQRQRHSMQKLVEKYY